MAILSTTYNEELDINVWYIHELEPNCTFHERAAMCWLNVEQIIMEAMQEQIASDINAAILAQLEIEKLSQELTKSAAESIFDKSNIQYEQKHLRRGNEHGAFRSPWYSRAGPLC